MGWELGRQGGAPAQEQTPQGPRERMFRKIRKNTGRPGGLGSVALPLRRLGVLVASLWLGRVASWVWLLRLVKFGAACPVWGGAFSCGSQLFWGVVRCIWGDFLGPGYFVEVGLALVSC